MFMSPLVSIIINNYNYGKYLEDAIQSALKQTYENVEVIIVDDGSTDQSRNIISKYNGKIKKIFKENGGQASACNVGFQYSKGDIIFFLDSDDYYYAEMVEKVVNLWQPGISKIHFRLDKINGEHKKIGKIPSSKRLLVKGDVWKEVFLCGNVVSPPMSGNAFSREALENIMPIPEEEHINSADSYILKRIPFFGKYEMIDEPLGVYRIHGNNTYAIAKIYDRYDIIINQLKRAEAVYPFYMQEAAKRNIKIDRNLLYKNVELLRLRILSRRIDPGRHPIQKDTLANLLLLGIKNCLFHKRYGLPRRIYELIITLWIFIKPTKKKEAAY